MTDVVQGDPQIQQLMRSDPYGYQQAVCERTLENLRKFKASVLATSANYQEQYISGLIASIELYSHELTIFRALETIMRNEDLTEEKLLDAYKRLDEFREKSRKLGLALAEQAQKQANG